MRSATVFVASPSDVAEQLNQQTDGERGVRLEVRAYETDARDRLDPDGPQAGSTRTCRWSGTTSSSGSSGCASGLRFQSACESAPYRHRATRQGELLPPDTPLGAVIQARTAGETGYLVIMSAFDPYEVRRAAYVQRMATRGPGTRSKCLFELINGPDLLSSEERLLALSPASWTAEAFSAAAAQLEAGANIEVSILTGNDNIPPLELEMQYKYWGEYAAISDRAGSGEEISIAIARDERHIIGFGIASRINSGHKFEILDVVAWSRRSDGLKQSLNIQGEEFSVGVGHVIVARLVGGLSRPVVVDAANDESRYIFRSLGFQPTIADDSANFRLDTI